MKSARASGLRQRALEELRVFSLTALYLWFFLGSFTTYRRLVLAETGVTYLHYGIALIEALVIAKVIPVGRMFGFTRRFDQQPLIVPVINQVDPLRRAGFAVRHPRASDRRTAPQP